MLRVEGNKATHGFTTQHREAMDGLKVARDLAVWYHRAFGRNTADFKAGAFVPRRIQPRRCVTCRPRSIA